MQLEFEPMGEIRTLTIDIKSDAINGKVSVSGRMINGRGVTVESIGLHFVGWEEEQLIELLLRDIGRAWVFMPGKGVLSGAANACREVRKAMRYNKELTRGQRNQER